jgi:hypothetical protein
MWWWLWCKGDGRSMMITWWTFWDGVTVMIKVMGDDKGNMVIELWYRCGGWWGEMTSDDKGQRVRLSSYHMRSTRPPWRAIALLTRLAKSIAVSPSCWYMGGKYQTSQTMAQLVIIKYRYCIMEYRLLFQKASPNLGSYCRKNYRTS